MKALTRSLIAIFACAVLALTVFAGPEPIRDYKDSKTVVPVPPSCDYSWTGFYVGIHAGYGFGDADAHDETSPGPTDPGNSAPATLHPDPDGIFGGAQVGYNFQIRKFVLGFETSFSAADIDGTEAVSPILRNNGSSAGGTRTLHEDTDWFGTARVRLGFTPFCRLLLYGTGGLAYGHVNYSGNTDFLHPSNGGTIQYPISFDEIQIGWTVGGGAEFALNHKWSLRAEYLYYDLGDESAIVNPVPPNPPFQHHFNWETKAHTVNVGLNYKF